MRSPSDSCSHIKECALTRVPTLSHLVVEAAAREGSVASDVYRCHSDVRLLQFASKGQRVGVGLVAVRYEHEYALLGVGIFTKRRQRLAQRVSHWRLAVQIPAQLLK